MGRLGIDILGVVICGDRETAREIPSSFGVQATRMNSHDVSDRAAAHCERSDHRCPHPEMCDELGCAQERIRLLDRGDDNDGQGTDEVTGRFYGEANAYQRTTTVIDHFAFLPPQARRQVKAGPDGLSWVAVGAVAAEEGE